MDGCIFVFSMSLFSWFRARPTMRNTNTATSFGVYSLAATARNNSQMRWGTGESSQAGLKPPKRWMLALPCSKKTARSIVT
jgi:hypothetical protein